MNAPSDPTKGTRDFARVVTWAAALSMGLTAAIIASVRQVNPTVEFKFSIFTVVAFLVTGFFTAVIFHKIFKAGTSTAGDAASPKLKRWPPFLFFAVVLATLVASIVFALRGVSGERRTDVAAGAGIALVVLSFGGWLGWRTIRFLEADDKRNRD
jgi:FtsH-binding integral membrane protein